MPQLAHASRNSSGSAPVHGDQPLFRGVESPAHALPEKELAALNGTGAFTHASRFDRLLTEDECSFLLAQAGTLPRENAPTPPAFDEVRWTDGRDTFRLQGGPAWDKLLDAMINLARYGAVRES